MKVIKKCLTLKKLLLGPITKDYRSSLSWLTSCLRTLKSIWLKMALITFWRILGIIISQPKGNWLNRTLLETIVGWWTRYFMKVFKWCLVLVETPFLECWKRLSPKVYRDYVSSINTSLTMKNSRYIISRMTNNRIMMVQL